MQRAGAAIDCYSVARAAEPRKLCLEGSDFRFLHVMTALQNTRDGGIDTRLEALVLSVKIDQRSMHVPSQLDATRCPAIRHCASGYLRFVNQPMPRSVH